VLASQLIPTYFYESESVGDGFPGVKKWPPRPHGLGAAANFLVYDRKWPLPIHGGTTLAGLPADEWEVTQC